MSQFLQQDMYEAASIDSVLDEMDAATNLNLGIS